MGEKGIGSSYEQLIIYVFIFVIFYLFLVKLISIASKKIKVQYS